MWPEVGEALDRTLADESCIENLTAEALRRWLPGVSAAVVPTVLVAAATDDGDTQTPPQQPQPQPAAVASQQSNWESHATEIVLAGLAVLWAVNAVEAMRGMDQDVPAVPEDPKIVVRSPAVLRIVAGSTPDDVKAAKDADAIVTNSPELSAARDTIVAQRQPAVFAVPAAVERKVEMATADVAAPATPTTPDEPVMTPAEVRFAVRRAAEDALDPAGQDMRAVAKDQGLQAASVQNHAVLTAAERSPDVEELEKTWIATIDGKTRPTHFAADGQRTLLAGTFTIGGELLEYPGDPTGSPAEVKNCRCRMGILAKDEALPSEVDRHTERLDGRDSVQVNRKGSQQDEIDRRAADGTIRAREDDNGLGRTAAGGWTTPSETEYDVTQPLQQTYRTFTNAVLAVIGTPTSDNRILQDGIDLSVRQMPLPLQWCEQVEGGHINSYTVGVIESAQLSGNQVVGSGYLLNTDEADQAAELVAHKVTGPSVDLAGAEWSYTDAAGNVIDDLYEVMDSDEPIFMSITKAELIGTTLVAMPAFGSTSLTLNAERETRDLGLVASAAADFRPREYDHRLFDNPQLSGPTLPTMGEDGRIYGHLAVWNQCHRSIQTECVMVPRSPSEYAHFHTSPAVKLDNGARLPVGRLTVGTGHADSRLRAAPAAAHYDNTGACFALVRVGEDAHGVWFSGVANPAATAEQVQAGITAPMSGDWRNLGQGLDLIAVLAVNTPGFAGLGKDDDEGRPAALVASVGPSRSTPAGGAQGITLDLIRSWITQAFEEVQTRTLNSALAEDLLARAEASVGPAPVPLSPTDEALALLAERGF